ncbi:MULTISPECIES: hypothetical protein [unclassified Bradyrhizobium]|uniref:hypothetical protein n=1 Tax=unclassified Bradyrhizobium TaxID=2631580 RepID=UPI002479ECB2|nr:MULTISPECIES: hypothetical protein [unclassified Bradyrhizobium]WGR69411.1 hypothetical protein MTX24_28860 [Bradyrhizobium sp. ISRA426]WGR81466.1 hypothetical protein MTX21_13970 [Bradyrhizobium sp. ISRA430]WGR84650.1 hypothetical protein MTX25_28535 [Bradyrhizobium sp. ISRA432]
MRRLSPGTIAVPSGCRADLDDEVIEGHMLVIRYFIFTGGVLLVLLLLAGHYMGSPVSTVTPDGQDVSVVRIHSAQRWPEKIILDTSAPQVPPPDVAATAAPPSPPSEIQAARGRTGEAFAMAAKSTAESKHATPRAANRRVAQRHHRHPVPRAFASNQTMFFGPRLSEGWW